MREIILQKLKEIEAEHDVQILYACESGSRAWGFASPDSDYDVRFIYAHKANKYLSIEKSYRDTIDIPVSEVLDIGGFELKKTLNLFKKSNAYIQEWLQSPIVYVKDEYFHQQLYDLMPSYFSPPAGYYNYYGTANKILLNELQQPRIKLKKYYYALRPILAAKWIIDKHEIPPMEFDKLLTSDPILEMDISDLQYLKSKESSDTEIEPIQMLNDYISEQIAYCESQKHLLKEVEVSVEPLDVLFRKITGISNDI